MDTDHLSCVQGERMPDTVLHEPGQAAVRFAQCVCPERPSGALPLASRADMLGLLSGSVCVATKETPSVKTAHHEPRGVFLLTEN